MLWIRLLCDIPGLRAPFAVPADIGNVLEHDFWWCCDGSYAWVQDEEEKEALAATLLVVYARSEQ